MSELDLQRQIDALEKRISELMAQQTLTTVQPLNPGDTNVGIGVSSPECALHIVTATNVQPRGIAIDNYYDGTSAGSIITRKARGTYAVPAAIEAADGLGAYCFQGYDGEGFGSGTKHAAIIQSLATENWSVGANGCNMIFTVTPNTTDDIFTAMTIDQDGDIFSTDWVDYSGTSTVTGFASTSTKLIEYRTLGKMVYVKFNIVGASNATGFSFTLPLTSVNDGLNSDTITRGYDNSGTTQITLTRLPPDSATVTCYSDVVGTAWTASNNKACNGWFIYYAA